MKILYFYPYELQRQKNIIHKPINIEEEKNEYNYLATHKN